MNSNTSAPEVGRWYARWDTGELFQVMNCDREGGATISREAFGGGRSTLNEAQWQVLPLAPADPPRTRMREARMCIVEFVDWVEPSIG